MAKGKTKRKEPAKQKTYLAKRDKAKDSKILGTMTRNGKKVNIPSYIVKQGDVIEIREKSREIKTIEDAMGTVVRRGIPQWLELEQESHKGTVKALPTREELTMPTQEQLVVELYSK